MSANANLGFRSRTAPSGAKAAQDEVKALVRRWQLDRDSRALERLVETFTPMVRSLARRYGHSSIPMEDLTQVASLGLIKAIGRFDADRGVPLQSFAIPTILGELRRHFRDTGWAVHVSRGAQEHALAVREAQEQLHGETGHSPTVGRIAEYLELSTEDVLEAIQTLRAYDSDSLDTPGSGEEAPPLIETLGATDGGYGAVEDNAMVREAMSALNERQREVLALSYFGEMSQVEIGERIGVSQMQVSRTMRAALDRLREHAGTQGATLTA